LRTRPCSSSVRRSGPAPTSCAPSTKSSGRRGYRLIGSFDDDDEQAAGAAGFRVLDYLAWGHALYCDDLSTRESYRGRGHAGALMDWMVEEARRLGCGEFHLDSGVGPDRTTAHRLYFNKGMRISAFHFQRPT